MTGFLLWIAFGVPLWSEPLATVRRDQYGVPHIYGKTDAGVVFALAYSQAEDNFWQLEEDYIRALGRASELYGASGLYGDLAFRLWRVEERAKKLYAGAPSPLKAICDSFAAGYNHYLATHAEAKPRLLKKMEPWHVLAFQSARPGLASGGVRREDVAREFPLPSGAAADDSSAGEGFREEEGSNMWAIAPNRSASGRAMLFLNPHVGFFGGGQRYEAHLESGEGLAVSGFAILGTPYIRSGFTAWHGWCHTNNNADIVDAYRETFDNPGDPLLYRYDGAYKKAESWTDTIAVLRNGVITNIPVKFRRTHHGPVAGIRDGHPLALRAVDRDPLQLMTQRMGMAKAKSLEEFRNVMAQRAITGSNTMYADRKGNIYYVHGNAIPKRDPKRQWAGIVDGADPATEWRGLHEYPELPQFTNPVSGYLQNCNSDPRLAAGEPGSGVAYPSYFVPERDNFRAKRSRQILESGKKFSFEEWSAAAFDTGVYLADREKSHLEKQWNAFAAQHPERAARLKEPAAMLRAWDGKSTVGSVPMALFMAAFLSRGTGDENQQFLTPELLEKAVAELEKDFGTWRIAWGEINRLQRIHTSGRLEAFSDTKPSLPVAGAPGTVGIVFNFYATQPAGQKKLYGRMGDTYVAVVEFGRRIRAGSLLVFGQSADPGSAHFLDQAPLYSEGKFKPAAYYKSEVRKGIRSTLTLPR
ncbi:MAG: penicillin acylase family protein [Candidatus Solibacter usitatus]|nr:penicillin acylase family protein [Candidatus Solibacter usitatus]